MSINQAAYFMQHLYHAANGYAEIRMIPESGGRPVRLYRPAQEIASGNWDALREYNRTHHIYHRVNVSADRRSRKQDMTRATALYVDIDGATDEHYKRLEDMMPPPTCIIFSGGGFHGYWLLRQPHDISTQDARDVYERTLDGMILSYGDEADRKAKDATRILRTPGFYNIKGKYDDTPLCEIVFLDEGVNWWYDFEELRRTFEPLGAPAQPVVRREIPLTAATDELPKRAQNYIQYGAMKGERNHELYYAARCYLDAGKTQFDAEQDLMTRALADGLTQDEARRTINSAFNNQRNPRIQHTMRSRYAIGDAKGQAS